jgi:tetratricopeptide (TPR) repeat protein
MIALLVITAAAVMARTRAALIFVACSWYGITLIPVLRILPTSTVVADRYAYLPSFAFCLLLALLLTVLSKRWFKAAIAGGIVICLLMALLTFRQNRVWQSNVTLWQHTVAVSPQSVQAKENLGTIYFFLKNYTGAFELFAAIQQAEPLNPIYDFFAGKYYFEQQDFTRATVYFQRALEKKTDLIDALYFLGECCENLNNRDCAVAYYWQTLTSGNLDRARYKDQAKARLQALGANGQ